MGKIIDFFKEKSKYNELKGDKEKLVIVEERLKNTDYNELVKKDPRLNAREMRKADELIVLLIRERIEGKELITLEKVLSKYFKGD
jgi:hypothetical protein